MAREIGASQADSRYERPEGEYVLSLVDISGPLSKSENAKFEQKHERRTLTFLVHDFTPKDEPSYPDVPDDRDEWSDEDAAAVARYENQMDEIEETRDKLIRSQIMWTFSQTLHDAGDLFPVYRGFYGEIPFEKRPDLDDYDDWIAKKKKIVATVELRAPRSGGEKRAKIIAAKPYRSGPSRAPKLQPAGEVQDEAESVDDVPF